MLTQRAPSGRRASLVLVLLLFAATVAAQQPPDAQLTGDGPWVLRVPYESPEQVRDLGTWADVWAVHPQKGYVLVQAERGHYDRLLAEGVAATIDTKRTATLLRQGVPLKNQTSGIPGYPCYRTVEETYATAASIVATYPDLATWTDVGDTWEKTQNAANGYDLMALKLTQSAVPGPKPKLFMGCSIHAREYTTAELCTRFAEKMAAGYDSDPDTTWLLDHHEVHFILVLNPDGRKKAETGLSWRKNTNNDYCSNTNSRGADLNRNFDFQWGCCGGSSGSQCDSTYRGSAPASEPEIQALQAYVASIFPDQRVDDLVTPAPDDATGIAMDVHASGELLLWSWGFTPDPSPNHTQLQTLGRKLAFFNGHEPKIGYGLYPTDGSSKDYYYGTLGVPGLLYELGTQFFESCAYFETSILPGNHESFFSAAKVVRTPYLTPAGPETLAVALPPRAFTAGDMALLSATVDDTRYSTRLGTEPSQTIAAAEYFVDLPPWDADAVALPMVATDGTFDTTAEGVEASVDTTGLAVGRHVFYVRGTDADTDVGAVSAVFLHLIDPASAPTLHGVVRDAVSLAGIAGATVEAGDFEATTDAGGAYSMQVPAGTYDVTVVADGYQSATTTGVAAAEFQTVQEDFDLYLMSGVWTDDAESGNPGWSVDAPWAITSEDSFSPTRSWTDSPGAIYSNNRNASLTSPVFDLQSYSGTTLSFRHTYDLEQGFDFGRVEISTDGGSNWTETAVYSGDGTASWALAEIALPALDGAAQAQIRFRIETDDSVQKDGWYVDDVLLRSVFSGNNTPAVTITAPADGAAFEVGEPIAFTGIATDVEDGDLAASLTWTSSLDGAIGSGGTFQTSTLSEGLHTVTAGVTDSGGASGSDEITVKVGGCTVEVDFDDGGAAGWTNDPASTCSTGDFVVATPTQMSDGGVVTQVGGDHTSGTGNAFFSATNTSAGTNDVDGGVCIVTSPVYSLTRDSSISIWYFHGQRDQGGDSGDFFLLEMSTNGGTSWTTLASYGDVTVNAAWTEATGNVTAGSDVQFRVQVSDGSSNGDLVEGGVDDVLICPTAPACLIDEDCDDTFYCDGAETCVAGSCQAGTPVVCDDGVSCTVDACNETVDACDYTADDGLCDNGLYCDGAETCDAVLDCQAGTPVVCDDSVACTLDACNETTDVCDYTPDDGFCDNTVFCDGAETCDAVLGCQPGGDPCPGLECDEVGDVCIECTVDADCDDTLYCNGAETCVAGTCQAGTPVACDDGVSCTVDACNETTDACDYTADDGLCDNGLYCDGVETCDAVLDCQVGTPVVCDDGVSCTVDACNETTDVCDYTPDDGVCSNGVFCDGAETCDPALDCQAGTPPSCDDGVSCTVDSCDAVSDACDNVADDPFCDNGLFCDGVETCDPVADCQAGSDPCGANETCDEAGDVCVACKAKKEVCTLDSECCSGMCKNNGTCR